MLYNLKKIKGRKTKSKRVGRGYGSGVGGHTTGKGTKGQKARKGNTIPAGFEGGQVPLYKKLPRLGGFRNPNAKEIKAIPLSTLNLFKEDSEVTPASLLEKRILRKLPKYGVKILAVGDITKKLTLKGFLFSKKAQEKLEKAGVKIIL